MKERVQKLMAQANIGSRRACEELIRQGRVRVNGTVIHLGDQADPETDVIMVDDQRLRFDKIVHRYFAINKPLNVLSSNIANRQDAREIIRDLLPVEGHFFTIGRLDAESDGLMVLTNHGEMANQMTHPRYEHTKTYKVVVYGTPTQETLDKWEKGVYLEEGLTAPCSIRVQSREAEVTVLKIVMIEGKKRQIRRVASLLGHPVKRLTRTHIGKLELGLLKQGEWRELKPEDIELMMTSSSDLAYIRRLRREQRVLKSRDHRIRAQLEQAEAERERYEAEQREIEQRKSKGRGKPATSRGRVRPNERDARDGRDPSTRPPRRPSRSTRPGQPGHVASRRDSERDGEYRPKRRTADRDPRDPRDGESRPARLSDRPARPGQRDVERRTSRDGENRPKRHPVRRDADRDERENESRPPRRPVRRDARDDERPESDRRPKRRPDTRPQRDFESDSDRTTGSKPTGRPTGRPAGKPSGKPTSQPGTSSRKPISRSPKPRTSDKPGAANNRNRPPRREKRKP